MAQYAGSGGGGGGKTGASVFKKKNVVKAPQVGPTLPKYTAPKSNNKPTVRATSKTSSRGSSSGGGGGRSSYSGSTGGSSYQGGGGGSLGSSRGGQISYSAPPPPPKPPSLNDFLGKDSTYLMQKSALDKARSDYMAQQGKTKTQYETSYTGDLSTLGENRTAALADLENDYAGRGLLQSGLYADSLATTNNDWGKRQSALEQAKAAFLSGLTDDMTNFSSEQTLTMQRAQQEAAARRAAQYGV